MIATVFWSRVAIGADNECWPWLMSTDTAGYGRVSFKGKQLPAHRVAYAFAKGEIQPGLVIRHTCDNPRCCNPAHLLTGTKRDNAMDAVSRGRVKTTPKETIEKIAEALRQCAGNQAAAARLLGFHRDRLVGIMGRRPDLRDLSTQLRNARRTTA